MRILLALALFMSFAVQAQRVRENIRQHNVIKTEKQEQKKQRVKKGLKKIVETKFNKVRQR